MTVSLQSLLSLPLSPEILETPHQASLLAGLLAIEPEFASQIRPLLQGRTFSLNDPPYLIALWSCLEDPEVDQKIDDALSQKKSSEKVLDALARIGISWEHETLKSLAQGGSLSAVVHLASAEDDALLRALPLIDSSSDLLDSLRHSALSATPEFFYAELLDWRLELGDDLDLRDRVSLDGLLLAINPQDYSRRVLQGDFDLEVLGDDRPIADLLTYRGINDWVDSLAIFRTLRDRNAFELAGAFAVAATLTDSFEDIDDQTLLETTPSEWIHQHPDRCAFQLSIDEDQNLSELLVEATIHQALLERDLSPAPLSGLPLSSGTAPVEVVLSTLEPLKRSTEISSRVALIRTLTDLRRLTRFGLINGADLTTYMEFFSEFTCEATTQALDSFDDDQAFANRDDWGVRGLFYLKESFFAPTTTDALSRCADGLFQGPLERAIAYRNAIEVLAFHNLDDEAE